LASAVVCSRWALGRFETRIKSACESDLPAMRAHGVGLRAAVAAAAAAVRQSWQNRSIFTRACPIKGRDESFRADRKPQGLIGVS
jgi:hypothetical protein